MTKQNTTPENIADADLDQATGGLLLPAVQAAREAARSSDTVPVEDFSLNFEEIK